MNQNLIFLIFFFLGSVAIPIYRYFKIRHDIFAIIVPILVAGGFIQLFFYILWKLIKNKNVFDGVRILCTILLLFSIISNCALFYQFGDFLNPTFMNAALLTSISEVKDFACTYYGIMIGTLIGVVIITIVLIKAWKKTIKVNLNLLKRIFVISIVFSLVSVGYLIGHDFCTYSFHMSNFQDFNFFQETYKKLREFNRYKDLMKDQPVELIKNEPTVDTVVLVIGESLTRNYCSTYGYPLNTTPFLKDAAQKQEILVFNDVISPHKMTAAVVPTLLTMAEDTTHWENFQWVKTTSLINVFKKAGFETYWFSNQEFVGIFSPMFPALYNSCSSKHFTHFYTQEEYVYDGDILKLLKRFCPDNGNKKLVVIHLMGNHFYYKHRYPEGFGKFTAKDVKNVRSNPQIVADYLNSILYNDMILEKIVKFFKEQNSLLIYLPDHGEEVYDIQNDAGHAGAVITKNYLEIPFYFWMSDKFSQKNPGLKERIMKYTNRPFISSCLPHAVMDIAQVQSVEFDPQKSIFSEKYKTMDNRCIPGINYDKQIKGTRNQVRVFGKRYNFRKLLAH